MMRRGPSRRASLLTTRGGLLLGFSPGVLSGEPLSLERDLGISRWEQVLLVAFFVGSTAVTGAALARR